MRKTSLAIGVLALVAGSAFADQSQEAVSGSTSVSGAAAGSISRSDANTAANSQNITINQPASPSLKYGGDYTVRSVGVAPDIVANPTAPCRVAVGIGGGAVGGALSIVGSTLDEGCDARADAVMLMSLGRPADAIARLCQKEEMRKVLIECAAPVQLPAESPQVSYNASTRTTTVREMNGYNH